MTPHHPEDPVAELPHGVPTSFRVFAEWLKENRRITLDRIELLEQGVNRRLDRVEDQVRAVHSETRRTNGRVTDLEQADHLHAVLDDEREKWMDELQEEQDRQRQARRARWSTREKWLGTALGTVATVATVLQLLHPF